jgi:hypothetical protein
VNVLEAAENVLCIVPATRARPRASSSATSTDTSDDVGTNNEEVLNTDNNLESPSKRQQQEDTASSAIISSLYWPSSPEEYYLFRPRGYHDRLSSTSAVAEMPQEALERRIQLLHSVYDNKDSWRNVVVGRDADNFCTKAEIAGCNREKHFCAAPINWLLRT